MQLARMVDNAKEVQKKGANELALTRKPLGGITAIFQMNRSLSNRSKYLNSDSEGKDSVAVRLRQ